MPRIPSRIVVQGTSAAPQALPAPGPALPREQTSDRQVNAAQEGARMASVRANSDPQANGNLIEAVAFKSGVNKVINHHLGAKFRGYEAKNVRGNPARFISVAQSPASLDALTITLLADVDCAADVWVYQ